MNTFYQVDRAKNKLKNKYDSGQTFIKKPNLKTFLDDVGNCTKIPRKYFERIYSVNLTKSLMDNFIYFVVTNEKVSYFPLQRIQLHFCNCHCHYQAKEKKQFPSDRVSKKNLSRLKYNH